MVVSVPGGLQVVPLYEPLSAADLAVTMIEGQVKTMRLPGSIGIDAPLVYSIDRQPSRGKVSLTGAVAKYKPNPGFHGSDGFGYTVKLKGATASGWVSVRVTAAGRVGIAGATSAPTVGTRGRRKATAAEVRP
jgi:hypothetical protein